MSAGDLADLKAMIGRVLHRSDVSDAAGDWIRLGEADINRRLRVRRMIVRADATLAGEYETLPADYVGIVSIKLKAGAKTALERVAPDVMADWKETANGVQSGDPAYYAIIGDELELHPVPADPVQVELAYYAALPSVSSDSTNWLLVNWPDLYLYAALVHSAPYLGDDERLRTWSALYESALRSAADLEQRDFNTGRLAPSQPLACP